MTPDELKYQIPIYRSGNIYMIDDGLEVCAMMGNERAYIRRSVRELCSRVSPQSVLEFGFGFGFTAQEFQDYPVSRHVIIEPNDYIHQQALNWLEGQAVPGAIEIVNSRYQDFETDEHFNLIYNDIAEFVDPYNERTVFEQCKEKFDFDFYSEFCTPNEGGQIPDDYFTFDYYGWHKIQMLVPYNHGD